MSDQNSPENLPSSPDNSPEPPADIAAEPTVGEALAASASQFVNGLTPSGESAAASDSPASAEPEAVVQAEPEVTAEPEESFADILADFEKSHGGGTRRRQQEGPRQIQATIISVGPEQVMLDVGQKIEGVLPLSAFQREKNPPVPGQVIPVSITGRTEDGYFQLSRFKVVVPMDWTALEAAFNDKTPVIGTLTGVIKGGASVDVGVRAFMPASRSGTRDAAELEALVGQQVTVRITKLDIADEDVVVDRRAILEEQSQVAAEGRYAALKQGDVLTGTVRSLMPYGAFLDLGGIDGLLHVSDISWTRITKPDDVLEVGQQLQVKVLKIDPDTRKLSLGLKQLQAEPWQTVTERYKVGQRISGPVTRVQDFGAFVELEPGIDGLIHVSEMSWGKKVRVASDIVKPGDRVDAVILAIKPEEKRISLGLKQTLTDPWTEVAQNFPVGSHVSGPVTKLMPFGAFVQIAEGVEGLVHISEIVADRRLNHPSEALRVGQTVNAQILAIDTGKRQIKLSMKQLIPTGIDEYIAEHKAGDKVSGRVVTVDPTTIELGEGIRGTCRAWSASSVPSSGSAPAASAGKADLSSLSSLLAARWKGSAPAPGTGPEPLQPGQIRTFKIVALDAAAKRIVVEPA
jgi:small subunit ribosomal protein S1